MNELDDWQFSANAYGAACQRQRSEHEQRYPSSVIDMLDSVRAGFDHVTRRRLTRDEADGILAAYGVTRDHD